MSVLDTVTAMEKARQIKLIVMDVDGVLTDGKLYFTADGMELKRFDVKDGHGIVSARKTGITFAIISGRFSEVTNKRAKELGIEHVFQGKKKKEETLRELVDLLNINLSMTAFIGDDVIDMDAMKMTALAVAPADAHPAVVEIADFVTINKGGDGAVREFIDFVMKSKI